MSRAKLAIALAQDSAGFVRRLCPQCHKQFKTRTFPSDGAALHRALLAKVEHAADLDCREPLPPLRCLYCGASSPAERWLTDEQRAFVDEVATALNRELRFHQLTHLTRTLDLNPRLTFLPIAPSIQWIPMAPEPDDLRAIPLLCCGEDAKAIPSWSQSVFCPRCGARQLRGGGSAPVPFLPPERMERA